MEVNRDDVILKTLTAGGTLNLLAFASRLENGDTLLTDAGNARIVQVNKDDEVVWQDGPDTDPLSVAAPLPTRAVRLRDGNTLISDQFNNRVIRINHHGAILASYGLPLDGGGMIGNNSGYDPLSADQGLYAPYDAKIIGDFTGLTPPFDGHGGDWH